MCATWFVDGGRLKKITKTKETFYYSCTIAPLYMYVSNAQSALFGFKRNPYNITIEEDMQFKPSMLKFKQKRIWYNLAQVICLIRSYTLWYFNYYTDCNYHIHVITSPYLCASSQIIKCDCGMQQPYIVSV